MMRAVATLLLMLLAATLGFCQAPETPAQPEAGDAEGVFVLMRAVWPGEDLTHTSFRIFADQQMRSLVEILPAEDGTAMAVLPPGEYYVMAVVDANGNNQVDAGDGFGFHGVTDIADGSQPAPVVVADGDLNAATIPVLMVLSEDGRLVPLSPTPAQDAGTLRGSFQKGEGADTDRMRLLVALPVTGDARPTVAVVGPHEFEVQLPAGEHRIAILVDEDDSGSFSAGDLMALEGFGDGAPVPIDPGSVTVVGPLTLSVSETAPAGIPPLVAGQLTGAQIPEGGRASVAFCSDATLRDEVFSVEARAAGRFAAVVEPGTYYLRATIDAAGDGVLGAGDMLGFFGVDDLLGDDEPAPLEISEDALLTDIEVPITARMDTDGKITAHTPQAAATEGPGNAGE